VCTYTQPQRQGQREREREREEMVAEWVIISEIVAEPDIYYSIFTIPYLLQMVAELSERIIVQEIVDEPDPVQDQILEQSQQRKVLMNTCVSE
jgi:hypothetical protein